MGFLEVVEFVEGAAGDFQVAADTGYRPTAAQEGVNFGRAGLEELHFYAGAFAAPKDYTFGPFYG